MLSLATFHISHSGAPRAERGPGVSSNVMELWFCKVQNSRRKCCWLVRKMMWSPKKKVFSTISTVFPAKIKWSPKKKSLLQNFNDFSGRSQAVRMRLRWAFHFSMSFGWAPSQAHGPPKIHGPRGHCPPCPPLWGPDPINATSWIMFRCQFLCHVLKALFFINIPLKLSYFCKKMQNFQALGAPPPDPPNSPPPLRISGYGPGIMFVGTYDTKHLLKYLNCPTWYISCFFCFVFFFVLWKLPCRNCLLLTCRLLNF